MMKGIDISKWQGSIDFSKVARNVEFVILREGYRKAVDERFLEYVAGCKKYGIPIRGVYHFLLCHISRRGKRRGGFLPCKCPEGGTWQKYCCVL